MEPILGFAIGFPATQEPRVASSSLPTISSHSPTSGAPGDPRWGGGGIMGFPLGFHFNFHLKRGSLKNTHTHTPYEFPTPIPLWHREVTWRGASDLSLGASFLGPRRSGQSGRSAHLESPRTWRRNDPSLKSRMWTRTHGPESNRIATKDLCQDADPASRVP